MSIRLQPYEDDETEGFGRYIHPEDPVNHPGHYQTENGLEAIDVIEAFKFNFHLGNAFKYIARAGKKNTYIQDLEKAAWYINREIERVNNA